MPISLRPPLDRGAVVTGPSRGLVEVLATFLAGNGYELVANARGEVELDETATAVGMAVVAGLLLRSVLAFVRAGFRVVPATGEDPSGLVLTWTFLLGFGVVLAGSGGLGLSLRRVDGRLTLTAGLPLLTAALPLVVVGLRFGSALPLPLGRLLVGTNAAFVPLGAAGVALGYRVWVESGSPRDTDD